MHAQTTNSRIACHLQRRAPYNEKKGYETRTPFRMRMKALLECLFLDLRSLADLVAQVVELCAAHITTTGDFDHLDLG